MQSLPEQQYQRSLKAPRENPIYPPRDSPQYPPRNDDDLGLGADMFAQNYVRMQNKIREAS